VLPRTPKFARNTGDAESEGGEAAGRVTDNPKTGRRGGTGTNTHSRRQSEIKEKGGRGGDRGPVQFTL